MSRSPRPISSSKTGAEFQSRKALRAVARAEGPGPLECALRPFPLSVSTGSRHTFADCRSFPYIQDEAGEA